MDYSLLASGRELTAITEIEGDSNGKRLSSSHALERASSVGPEEKVLTLKRREDECDVVVNPPELACELLNSTDEWNFEVFGLADIDPDRVLSYVSRYRHTDSQMDRQSR